MALLGCAMTLAAALGANSIGAAVITLDTTAIPQNVRNSVIPGATTDMLKFEADAMLGTPLSGLAAGQAYHLALHLTPGTAFRLDPATADLEVILYTQNRASTDSSGGRPIAATNIGSVQLTGQNVTSAPLSVNLKDEIFGGTRAGVSISGPSTYADVKPDPTLRALVTDLTFDFTMPASYTGGTGGPFNILAVDMAGTETVPHGQSGPSIAGFAQVPEPATLGSVGVGGLLMRRRRAGRVADRS
jgi:hypothetical protein